MHWRLKVENPITIFWETHVHDVLEETSTFLKYKNVSFPRKLSSVGTLESMQWKPAF